MSSTQTKVQAVKTEASIPNTLCLSSFRPQVWRPQHGSGPHALTCRAGMLAVACQSEVQLCELESLADSSVRVNVRRLHRATSSTRLLAWTPDGSQLVGGSTSGGLWRLPVTETPGAEEAPIPLVLGLPGQPRLLHTLPTGCCLSSGVALVLDAGSARYQLGGAAAIDMERLDSRLAAMHIANVLDDGKHGDESTEGPAEASLSIADMPMIRPVLGGDVDGACRWLNVGVFLV